ncbi:hypothetical protein BGZ80_005876 [Entomortierella chlamydospora]|uniref:Uncharacterized protein n=1 Tax=Entomortierella chlamydospora TaxID=101097 RepID=A0A9P6T4J3_9FUNG|nr:hypothetical protein BGZ79_002279 [Entomortierella chlamydospora]KAG0024111.1 hypothetical protein BGZ80_005876 [Entomortierella chlamydospora]
MLQSSFDWIGEAYTLRAPTEPAHSASQMIGNIEPDERISNESDGEATESLLQGFKTDEWEQDTKSYDSLSEREEGGDRQEEANNESEGDENEEEETLQVPERHIAICQAVRVLRRSSISNHTSFDYKSLRGEGQVTSDGPSSHQPEIGNPSSEPAAICGGALSLSSTIEPNEAQAIVEDNLEHQQEDGLSPLISSATSEFGQSLSSPEWPPANQEAAKRLQLSGGAIKEECFTKLLGHDQTEAEGISATAPWSIQFSPIILPTDPEDTSILEPLDALNEADQVYDTTIQVDGWGSDCSLPEMIRSEDWQGFDDSEALSLK